MSEFDSKRADIIMLIKSIYTLAMMVTYSNSFMTLEVLVNSSHMITHTNIYGMESMHNICTSVDVVQASFFSHAKDTTYEELPWAL